MSPFGEPFPSTSMSTRSPLLSLPPEIRSEIYMACISLCTFYTLLDVLQLRQTCRAICQESTATFDNHNYLFPTINRVYDFLRKIGRPRRGEIRRLSFKYEINNGFTEGQVNEQDIELVRRTIRLMNRECRMLRRLWVWVWETAMKRHLGLGWHEDDFNYVRLALKGESLRTTAGLPELERLRGLTTMCWVPYVDMKLSQNAEVVLGECRHLMMLPK
ncbi:hypothetical protein MMC17_000644 [Xylographa soralifera]|nr:hypothetical protein [Xylographa soralifera]